MNKILWVILISIFIFILVLEIQIPEYLKSHKDVNRVSVYDYFWYEWRGFWLFFGLVGCVVLILFSKLIVEYIIQREESYYE